MYLTLFPFCPPVPIFQHLRVLMKLDMNTLNRWAPEYFTRQIYNKLTEVRVIAFLLLVALYVIDGFFIKPDFIPYWFRDWGPEIFTAVTTKMLYLLLSIGVFTATFFPIVIKIVRKKKEAEVVTRIWANLVKYTIYPFAAAIVIWTALFLLDVGVSIPALFSLFLLFIFLTVNSFYTTIRMAQILVDESYTDE